MKKIRGKIVLMAVVAAVVVTWLVWNKPHGPTPTIPQPVAQPVSHAADETGPTQRFHSNPANVKRASEFTDEEKAEFAKLFATRLRPAAEKWFKAYNGHIAFNLSDLTPDKFVERIGNKPSFRQYTFVMGDVTFVIQDGMDEAKVDYMMSRPAALALNDIPAPGTVPDLSTPVTRAQIISMVQADSGVQFQPNEVIIRPSAATGINGGEFVHTIPTGADPNNGLSSKVDMVFNSDGKLVNYERDPFF